MHLMSTIKGRLSEKAYALFALMAVGHFLDMTVTLNSSTILHFLLSRKIVRQDDGDPFCMNFGVGGHILRFRMKEFALATGLNFKLTAATKEDLDNPLVSRIHQS
ncbi:hypothetical protein C5167_018959 [Papaver somniferum]|uniref:Uncharacterized protein n=1 Tax=Papaver somniferum TaxID=3469 RepID=A0A4Y7IS35_PAPSO|nr:hypothetical protein C5167_018959 [Papaver somniferum]